MLSLQPDNLSKTELPISTTWLHGACMEAKGKQDLWLRQKPEVITALREQAIIQSSESSNRIEGVTVPVDRLRPILIGKSRPQDRCEEELVGYRQALNWIYSRKRPVKIDSRIIIRCHEMAQGGFSGDAGQWKKRNNAIIEILPNGERRIRFKPVMPKQVPKMVNCLCTNYEDLYQQGRVPALLAVATFIFDFLCIHPFRDGNGRVSRLLTTLLLQEQDFVVGRYISLERLVEESKEDYYRILEQCSKDWHKGKNELVPWWNYFLGILKRAYDEFARRIEESEGSGKSELVRQIITGQLEPFTLSELQSQCPSVSMQLIKKVLAGMKKAGKVRLNGRGRGASWEII
ncbi:Fic family protein [Planctomycetota bacterium]